jgi:hypothetical protein
MKKLIDILRIDSSELRTSFQKASLQGGGTPQEVADYRETSFSNFISRYFPFPHRITKGKIHDSYDNVSASIDCLVINPAHPYTIDSSGKYTLILADGVDIAIELKPDLSTKSELVRGLVQAISVKRLRRAKSPILLKRKQPEHIIEFSRTIPVFIFSMEAKTNPLDTAKEIADYYAENQTPLIEQIDHVIINDCGIISNYKYPEISHISDKSTGLIFEEWKDLTLGAFMAKMNDVFYATATISDSILQRYIGDIKPNNAYLITAD